MCATVTPNLNSAAFSNANQPWVSVCAMKKLRYLLVLFTAFTAAHLATAGDEARPKGIIQPQSLPPAGLAALEHASNLVAAINREDWKALEAAGGKTSWAYTFLPARAAKNKEWAGIGAYQRYDLSENKLTLFFTDGPRNNPHAYMFAYKLDGPKFAFVGLDYLGW